MKRTLVTGFACPENTWEEKLNIPGLEIITLEKLISLGDQNFKSLVRNLKLIFLKQKIDTLILHDFGVTIGLAASLSLLKNESYIQPNIILFNGAFRGFNILKSRHPFNIQFMSYEQCKNKININGGECSIYYKDNFLKIKSLYRQIILASLLERVKNIFLRNLSKSLKLDLGVKVCMFFSKNDPFINSSSLEQLIFDFKEIKSVQVDYGHFPYSIDKNWFQLIKNFESEI